MTFDACGLGWLMVYTLMAKGSWGRNWVRALAQRCEDESEGEMWHRDYLSPCLPSRHASAFATCLFFPMFSLVIYVHFNDGLTPMLHRHLTYKLGLVGVVEEVI